MKFNYVKSLVLFLGIALLFTITNQGSARSFSDNLYGSFTEISSLYSYTGFYYKGNNAGGCEFNRYSLNNTYTSTLLKSYNQGDFNSSCYVCNSSNCAGISNSKKYANYSYNFVKFWKGCTLGDCSYSFFTWDDVDNYYVQTELPGIGYTYDFDGVNVYFTDYFPRHGNFVLLDRENFHSIQLIGKHSLIDKVIYADPLEQGNNVYLIDFHKKKAYSYRESDPDEFNKIFFAKFDSDDEEYFFNSLSDKIEYSYTIIGTGLNGNYFYPSTAGQYSYYYNSYYYGNSYYATEIKERGLVFQYQRDLITEKPDWYFPNSVNGSGNSYNDQVRSYEQCIADNTPIKDLSHMGYKCLEVVNNNTNITDEDFMELFMYIENLDYYIGQNVEYTGYYPNTALSNWCGRWVRYAESIYPDYTTGDYHDLVFEAGKYVDTDNYDLEVVCGSHPTTSSEQSWTCQYLGIGCDGFSMGMGYDQVKSIVKPFWDDTIGQLVDSFNSGYNYFNIPTCSSDMYGKSYGWANVVFIVLVAFLLFEFYQLFKS